MTEKRAVVVMSDEWCPKELDLFMFSAATWLTHRIHYDRDYARSEGHADLVVHGPFQGARLAEVLGQVARSHGAEVVQLNYRHRRPALCGQVLRVVAALAENELGSPDREVHLDVWIEDPQGAVTTSGEGVVRFPDHTARTAFLNQVLEL